MRLGRLGPFRPPEARRVRRTALTLLVACTAALTGCGGTASVAGQDPAAVADQDPTGDPTGDIAERARAVPGVDDVGLVHVDPDGQEHDALPADPDDRTGWVTRIDLAHDIALGAGWAAETVAGLTELQPASSAPRLEIWLHPAALAEVSALAYPAAADGSDPVRDAYLMVATPGVVRSVFDGGTADVRVRDASDLAKVADVAAAQGVRLDQVRTTDGASVLDVAAVPPRPPQVTVPAPWPADPAAPNCAPGELRLSIAGGDAATGHRALIVAATNTGATPCTVDGYPALSFRTLGEQALDVTVTNGGSFMAQDPGPARIVIPAGARALSVAGWNAMPTAGNPDLTAEILLAVGPGVTPAELPLTSHVLTPEQAQAADLGSWQPMTTLDIVDGGEVEVTAWAPDTTQF